MKDRLWIVGLILIVVWGVIAVFGITWALDYLVWMDNIRPDGSLFLERYTIQAVEAHVLGVGVAIAVELGLLFWWNSWRKAGR